MRSWLPASWHSANSAPPSTTPRIRTCRRFRRNRASRPHRRRLHGHAPGAGHEIKLEFDQLGRAEIVSLRAHAGDAAAQAPLERSERLPFQAVLGIAGRLALRDRRSGEMLVPMVVMTIGAGEIELAFAAEEELAAL